MFCKKCGSLLVPKKIKEETVFVCPSCNYKDKEEVIEIVDKIKQKKDVEIVDEDKEDETLSTTNDVLCPKCGNKKAYYWLEQTRAADEAETRFLKCTACKHVWREYD